MGGGVGGFAEFDAQFKFAKIQNSHLWRGGSQNLMLSSNLLKTKIPICWGGGWGGDSQNLVLSSNLLKSKIPICGGGEVSGGGLSEFDGEFKFAKTQNFHLWGGLRNLVLSSNLLKSKIPILWGGRGEGGLWNQLSTLHS